MQSDSLEEDKEAFVEEGTNLLLNDRVESKTGNRPAIHGETWHGGQAYKKVLSEGQLTFTRSGRWGNSEDASKKPLVPRPSMRRQLSSPMAGIPDSPSSSQGIPRPLPVESTVHGVEPALPDHHFWRIRSFSKHSTLRRQPSNLVLVLPRPERVIDIGEESKRDPGGSVLGGLGASLARSLSLSLSSLSQKTKLDERERQPVMLDEAICRICLDQLTAGETWRLECHCKGDMALAHEECALRWFNLRGSRLCEVCGAEVENLPVTLERLNETGAADGSDAAANGGAVPGDETVIPRRYRDVPMVFVAATIAYFCFFEQMLVSQEGKDAVSVSIPAAIILAVTTTSMAARTDADRMWSLAAVQFVFVVVIAQITYSLAHVGGVGACFIGGFVGVIGTIIVYSIIRDVRQYHNRRSEPPSVPHGMGIAVVIAAGEGTEMVESGGGSQPPPLSDDEGALAGEPDTPSLHQISHPSAASGGTVQGVPPI